MEGSPWIIPTRPCPFFARGNCFFFEKCNFLHEISPRTDSSPSTVSDSDGHEWDLEHQHNSREGSRNTLPNMQSRFSVDFDSSSEEETRSDTDDEESHVLTASVRHNSPSPSRSSSSRSNSRKNSPSPSDKGDSHVRDSVMTITIQNPGSRMNDLKVTDESDKSSRYKTRPNRDGARKYSRGPQLSLTIPSPSESFYLSHQLVLEDLKRTLRSEPGPSTSLKTADHRGVVITGSAHGAILRQRSDTIRPQYQIYGQHDQSPDINDEDDHCTPALSMIIPSLSPGPSVDHGFVYWSPGTSPAALTTLKESADLDDNTDITSSDMPEPEPKPKTPQTPGWLKPLRLAAILNPQANTTKPLEPDQLLEPDQPDLLQSQSLSPVSLLAQYLEDFENDDAITQPALDDSTPAILDDVPTNSPRTIVLSDAEDDMNSVPYSRAASLNIDMTPFPPARSEHDDDNMSSTGSITLSVLMGGSPGLRFDRGLKSGTSPESVKSLHLHRGRGASPKPEEFRTALEHRAQRIKQSVSILNLKKNEPNFIDSVRFESPKSAEDSSNTQKSDVSLGIPLPENSLQVQNLIQPSRSSNPVSSPLREIPERKLSVSPLRPRSANSRSSPDPSYRPQLLFAIASDRPEMVEDLLASGQSSVNEMADSGTDLLEFTVSNGNLKHKTQIVKTLLKYGADPAILTGHENQGSLDGPLRNEKKTPGRTADRHMNAAMEYYLTRPSLDLDSKPALQVLEQSSFAPLAKARFDIIGQDRVLDEFYRVIGLHSQRKSRNALVILLCGGSGLGKSFLAQKVGSLLNVPIHTINMTALRSQHDLWQCLSTGAEDASPDMDLGEFLVENQGRRCVVVLDEIEKVDDPKALNPLLLPWDIGRCSLEQKKHTDTSQVIWIATSNLGQKLVAEHFQQWKHPDTPPNRNEYIQLATAIRRSTSEVLGAPLLSRITAILPFLPFTLKEKKAIGTEAVLSYQDLISGALSSKEIDTIVDCSVNDPNLVEEEGARSLYRVVEAHMLNFKEVNKHA